MSKGGGRSARKTTSRISPTSSVSIGGVVQLGNGKYALKLRIGGKEVLVPASGNVQGKVQAVRAKLLALGSPISGKVTPQGGAKVKISLTGDEGSVSMVGTLA